MSIEAAAPRADAEVTIVRRRRRRRRSSGHDRPRRVDRLAQAERIVAIAAVIAAIGFRVVFLMHAGGLWRDEANTVNTAAASSLGEVWRLSEFESFPVSMMLVLRVWIAIGLGGTDFTLRLFGFIAGLALPAAAWFALRRLTRAAPLASLAFLAVNPEIVRWGSTVRAWGIGAALGIVAMVLVREASVALTRRRIVFALIASVLAVQVTYQNAVLLFAIIAAAAAVACARRRWKEALLPIGIGAVTSLSLLPMLGIFQRRAAWNALGQVPVTFGDLISRAWDMVNASGDVVVTCALALLALGLVAALQWVTSPSEQSANRARRGVATYAAAAGVLGAGAIGIFYRNLGYPTQPWYYVGVLSFLFVCAEVAVASAVAARLSRTVLVVLASVVLVVGAPAAWVGLREPQTNIDAIAATLRAEATPDDVVIVSPWYLDASLSRYYQGGAPLVTIPPIDDVRVHRYDLVKAAMLTPDPMAPALVRIRRALESGHQVWVVGSLDAPGPKGGGPLPPPPLPETGWNAGPYLRQWGRQTQAYLQAHALEGREIAISQGGGRFETVGLAAVKGWQ